MCRAASAEPIVEVLRCAYQCAGSDRITGAAFKRFVGLVRKFDDLLKIQASINRP
jgi:hypothetical protein